MSFKASATYSIQCSSKAEQAIVERQREIEGKYYLHLNIYSIPEVEVEADKFVKEAIQKLDASMKGWKPVAEGKETHYEIYNTHKVTQDLKSFEAKDVEFSYTRYYTK